MRRYLPTLLVSYVLLFAPVIHAQYLLSPETATVATLPVGGESSRRTDLHMVQSDGKTLSQAVEQVRRQYNGRIVSAETKRSGNREVHHIKVLMDGGKVKTVRVNGRRFGNKG